jgi:hypothetical protein
MMVLYHVLITGGDKEKLENIEVEKYKRYYIYNSENRAKILETYRARNMILWIVFLLKVGIIMLMSLITVIYQFRYQKVKGANTIFGGNKVQVTRYCMTILFTSLCGAVSIVCVMFSRNGINWKTINNHKCAIFTVGLIFGLFEISSEASGLNRFLHQTKITNNDDEYGILSGVSNLSPLGKSLFVLYQMNSDPFVTSLLYTLIGIAILIAICMTFTIIIYIVNNKAIHFSVDYQKIMWLEPKSHKNHIQLPFPYGNNDNDNDNDSDSEKTNELDNDYINIKKEPITKNNKFAFLIEIMISSMFIPALPFIVRNYITNDEPPSYMECACALGFAFCGSALHLILQYTGCITIDD